MCVKKERRESNIYLRSWKLFYVVWSIRWNISVYFIWSYNLNKLTSCLHQNPFLNISFSYSIWKLRFNPKKKPEQMNGTQKKYWNKKSCEINEKEDTLPYLADFVIYPLRWKKKLFFFYIQYARNMQSLYEHLKHTALIVSSLHVSIIIFFYLFTFFVLANLNWKTWICIWTIFVFFGGFTRKH